MIIVHIQHFLNSEGQNYFPKWLEAVANILRQFEGFVSLQQLSNLSDGSECHLLLEFESLELLDKWSSSDTHNELVSKLDPFKIRPYKAYRYRCEEKLN